MFPDYTRKERRIDGVVHVVGLGAAAVAAAVLFDIAVLARDARVTIAAALYGVGLVSTFAMSAAYNLIGRPDWKEVLRRYDHAAIFVMIAGTYTPFTLVGLGGDLGLGLLALVWLTAIAGALLKLLRPRRFERAAVALYLALGWIFLPALGPLVDALSVSTLALLVIGGALYTAGVAVHLRPSLPYQNAAWHACVLAGAGCHYAAVLDVLGA